MPKSQEFPKVFGKLTVKTGRAVELPGYGTIEIASYSHEKNRALLVFKPIVPPATEKGKPEEAWPGIPLPAKEPAVDSVSGPQ